MQKLPIMETGEGKSIKLPQRVYEQIKQEIITCKLSPGQQLNEGFFADRYQVSKTPVREALALLQQSNLVEYHPNKGFTVTTITLKDIHEIFEARLFLERNLIGLAIQHISEAEIEGLGKFTQVVYDRNDPVSVERCIQANTAFHLGIASASRSPRLYRYYSELLEEAQRLIYMDLTINNILGTWNHSHLRFLQALACRDQAAGIRAVEESLDEGKKRVLGI